MASRKPKRRIRIYGDEYLSTQEAADMVGLSFLTIRHRFRAGTLKGRKVGSSLYFKEKDLLESFYGEPDNVEKEVVAVGRASIKEIDMDDM